MARRLAGQVGIVTGAGRGIGRAVAQALAAHGMHLALVARTAEQVHETARLVEGCGVSAFPFAADVTDRAGVDRLVAHAEQRLGPIDLLVNNAGRSDTVAGRLWEVDVEDVWATIETNLRGPLLYTAAVLGAMVGRRFGRIVNVNSLGGASPLPGFTGYTVSKAALYRLTDCLAQSVEGTGVRVFDLSPGLVRTAMTEDLAMWGDVPADQWTPAEHVAAIVADLAAGRYDALHGRLLHAGEDLDALLAAAERIVALDARVLRLVPYGDDDPLFSPH
jgi:NAD(P)-dependent dehydrogenase (short-subunit alcohol dehydrogenase family)